MISLATFIRLLLTCAFVFILTPLVRQLAFLIGAVDKPNQRRINKVPMPSMGGLAIYIGFVVAGYTLFRSVLPQPVFTHIVIASGIIVITGIIDDIFELTPKWKLLGIILAALYLFFFAQIRMSRIKVFGFDEFILPWWLNLIFTIVWVVVITNSVNLIDGLDGLASGVSLISLITMGIVALFHFQGYLSFIATCIFMLVAAILGFLPYNFFPAKIYLGDTGALFLGFMISLFSLMGLKNATFIMLLTPIIILGVPMVDTFFAVIRRKVHRKPISSADKMHLHHRLLAMGFTHRGAVLTIYGLAILFSMVALIYNYISFWGVIVLSIALFFCIELFVEMIGLIGDKYTPLLHTLKFIGNRAYRLQVINNWKEKQAKKKNKKWKRREKRRS